MLRYIKILIRLLFYKIYFKIIAMNLFKKKKKIHQDSISPKPIQMLEIFHADRRA